MAEKRRLRDLYSEHVARTNALPAGDDSNSSEPTPEPTAAAPEEPQAAPTPKTKRDTSEGLSYDFRFNNFITVALEQDVLTALCTHDTLCPLLIKRGLGVKSFEGKLYQNFARLAIDHWDRYQEPIRVLGLRNEYWNKAETEELKAAFAIIEQMEKNQRDITPHVLLAQLENFIVGVEIDRIVDDIEGARKTNDVGQALAKARQFGLLERKFRQAAKVPTAEELRHEVLPPLEWILKDLMPEGVILVCGPPKLGKSLLTLATAISVAIDGAFSVLGSGPSKTGMGVLYLGLEDNKRRLQSRIQTLIQDGYELSRLHYQFLQDVPQLSNGLIGHIEAILDEHPYIKLVTIDTLQLACGDDGRDASYKRDVGNIKQFAALAQERGISLILVHHTNKGKGDAITKVSGTQGIAGTVDTIVMLTRIGDDKDEKWMGRLEIRGRDLIEYPDKLVELDKTTARWQIIDDWDEANTKEKRDGLRERILNVIRENAGPMSPATLAHRLSKTVTNIRHYLSKMKEAGLVDTNGRGLWDVKAIVGSGRDGEDGRSVRDGSEGQEGEVDG